MAMAPLWCSIIIEAKVTSALLCGPAGPVGIGMPPAVLLGAVLPVAGSPVAVDGVAVAAVEAGPALVLVLVSGVMVLAVLPPLLQAPSRRPAPAVTTTSPGRIRKVFTVVSRYGKRERRTR
ncbi:hypothetical protein GCM10011594_43420 [Nakamurella endophytica]|uniref:Uncharacterized protein n=1 Tax=Nakamurella endophytica TaxID=1748367 RepID=A0A917WPH8_9ACTN|nr:hypothetical protein GCM10011594_43420 [Nakamurella endophytica]